MLRRLIRRGSGGGTVTKQGEEGWMEEPFPISLNLILLSNTVIPDGHFNLLVIII